MSQERAAEGDQTPPFIGGLLNDGFLDVAIGARIARPASQALRIRFESCSQRECVLNINIHAKITHGSTARTPRS